jgi:preprotein translocase subunit SecG
MTPLLFAAWYHPVFMVAMLLTAIFLILIVLVQRGRGGGLAGAFGGAGGQSAFGTKAGDLFTKITIGVATFWIVLCLAALKFMGTTKQGFGSGTDETSIGAPKDPDADETESDSEGAGAENGTMGQEDGAGSADDAPAEKED